MAERMLEYAALLRNDLARSGWKPAPMGLVVWGISDLLDN